jgi:hypothetical protein
LVRVLGLEQEPARVAEAVQGCELMVGGFEALPAFFGQAAIVRALNVVRGYRADEVEGIHRALCGPLVEGGLLLEGSTDVEGHVLACHVFRCAPANLVAHDGLLLYTDLSRGFSPWLFRDVLPRDLRRAVVPGSAVHRQFTAWAAASDAAGAGATAAARFLSGLRAGTWLEATDWERAHGYVRLRLERGPEVNR